MTLANLAHIYKGDFYETTQTTLNCFGTCLCPYLCYVDNDGSYQGYDIELGNQLAQDLGVKVKYVSVDAANRAEYLISNKVDITLANFTVTDERKKQVDFALPYMKVSLGVVSPKTGLPSQHDSFSRCRDTKR